jgi:hypothetical protein
MKNGIKGFSRRFDVAKIWDEKLGLEKMRRFSFKFSLKVQ